MIYDVTTSSSIIFNLIYCQLFYVNTFNLTQNPDLLNQGETRWLGNSFVEVYQNIGKFTIKLDEIHQDISF